MVEALLAVVVARGKNPLPLVDCEFIPPETYPKDYEARVLIERWIDDTFASEETRSAARRGALDLIENGWADSEPAFRASAHRRPLDLEFVVGARLIRGLSDCSHRSYLALTFCLQLPTVTLAPR
jgi:hypothetical protein